jgi:hypothetical protein
VIARKKHILQAIRLTEHRISVGSFVRDSQNKVHDVTEEERGRLACLKRVLATGRVDSEYATKHRRDL